jgi:hypothetical protein
MSKYDGITTAESLIREVISNGLSTELDDKNRAADIFGQASIGELDALASSEEIISGKNVSDMFYFILFHIWNWREAANFFNQHSNPAIKEAASLKAELRETGKKERRIRELEELEDINGALRQEIMKLKARLYDLMAAE